MVTFTALKSIFDKLVQYNIKCQVAKNAIADRVENEKKRQHELEMARAGQSESSSNRQRNYIKLASYKEGDDVDVYFHTFEKVKTANS